ASAAWRACSPATATRPCPGRCFPPSRTTWCARRAPPARSSPAGSADSRVGDDLPDRLAVGAPEHAAQGTEELEADGEVEAGRLLQGVGIDLGELRGSGGDDGRGARLAVDEGHEAEEVARAEPRENPLL